MTRKKNSRNAWVFEKRSEKLLGTRDYLLRQAIFICIALGFLIFSLAVGMMGYHYLVNMSWLDAFLNASMIMGGMGPVNPITTDAGKFFAGLYALYSGLGLLATVGFVAAPLLHRFFHYFHLEIAESEA